MHQPDPITLSRSDIFLYSPQIKKPKRLVEGESPALAPNGSKIAFCVPRSTTAFSQVQIINADGSEQKDLTKLKNGACPTAWSPDGESLAFNAFGGSRSMVGIVSKDGTNVRLLIDGYGAQWSPDGKRLLFCREGEKRGMKDSIWVINAEGSNATKVIEDSSGVIEATWLPNGTGIAFASEREHHRSAIYAVKLDGTELTKIADNDKVGFFFPRFSPDGRKLVVDGSNSSGLAVLLLDLSSRHAEKVVNGGHPSIVWKND